MELIGFIELLDFKKKTSQTEKQLMRDLSILREQNSTLTTEREQILSHLDQAERVTCFFPGHNLGISSMMAEKRLAYIYHMFLFRMLSSK
jgi:hypothetical protein